MTQPTLPNSTPKEKNICPFIGLSDDPGTALSYPSVSNYCHHAKPISPVKRAHQAQYCLGGGFEKCTEYKRPEGQALPREIAESAADGQRSKMRMLILSALLVITVIVILIIQANLGKNANQVINEQTLNIQAIQTITQMFSQTQTALSLTPTPTLNQEPIPSPTAAAVSPYPTSFPPHTLEIPFGNNPQFVIHRVVAGESYMRYMQDFNTTKEAIAAVNYGTEPILWADAILIIPVNVTDATGLPAFSAFQVTEQNLTVETLASSQGADLDLLLQYNNLPAGYIFSVGEWVLIPH